MELFYENRMDREPFINVWNHEHIKTRDHIHNPLEFIYVRKGRLTARVGSLEGEVNEGELLVISSYCPHLLLSQCDGSYVAVFVPSDRLPRYAELLHNKYFGNLKIADTETALISRLISIMLEIGDGRRGFNYKNEQELQNLINVFASIVLPKCTYIDRSQSMNLVSDTACYIINHFHENITVHDIAKKMLCNQQQLSLRFRSVMQMSIPDYIISLRLSKAKSILMGAQYQKLDEIAELSGFNSTRHFLKCFKDQYGCTPTEMRKSGGEAPE